MSDYSIYNISAIVVRRLNDLFFVKYNNYLRYPLYVTVGTLVLPGKNVVVRRDFSLGDEFTVNKVTSIKRPCRGRGQGRGGRDEENPRVEKVYDKREEKEARG